ncbi:MAG TPA: hypothetical protein VML35_10205 [Gaiellaceae bacterium]|nr:hypothetical protein [Gaiellaceae bacterium]
MAAFATFFTRDAAQAGHDGTNVLHLGEANNAPAGSFAGTTILNANAESFALDIKNAEGGVSATSSGSQPAFQGHAIASGRAGVEGISHLSAAPEDFGMGHGTGVDGTSGTGVGVAGRSKAGVGVQGSSDAGTGGHFESGSGQALSVFGRASVTASVAAADGDTLFVENQQDGTGGGGAISALSHGDSHAVEGIANGPEGVGVRGLSGADPWGGGSGYGVMGQSGSGTGVEGLTQSGIGVEARSDTPTGIALNVRGTSRFSTAGAAVLPGGDELLFVPNPAVTGESHISLTLAGDPGQSHVSWIEQHPGAGFTVHLSRPLRRGQDVPLTYFITEPA